MTNAVNLVRSLIIYGVCLPLAVMLGYMLANPQDITNTGTIALILGIICIPLLLRWHYPWLVVTWNMVAGFYFLPGGVPFSWPFACASFGVSFLGYVMNKNLKFISVPSINRPLFFLFAVIVITAKLTGGLGMSAFGGNSAGGKRYVGLFIGVIAYYALTAQRIPLRKAGLYVNLFFLGATTAAIGNLASIVSPSLYFIFQIFPADFNGIDAYGAGQSFITRLGGVCVASVAVIYAMLGRFGIQKLFNMRHSWRFFVFMGCILLSLMGGFRSKVIEVGLIFMVVFYLEGLLRSKYFPAFLLVMILGGAMVIPFANKLPSTIQRSLTFLPLDLDPDVIMNAAGSTDWRLQMWEKVVPQIPRYFWLGKGYSIDAHELDMTVQGLNAGGNESDGSALAGDYHNGPLSVIIPFGIFGVLGFLWLLVASYNLLLANYRYGEGELGSYNRILLASFVVKVFLFFTVIGALAIDVPIILGLVGLSIALNGGKRSPADTVEEGSKTFSRIRYAPAH